MEILADKQFVIDMLVSERAVRFSVVHCVMPEPEVVQPSIWAWLVSYVLPLSSPEPMQEICMLTWSHSVHAGYLSACVLLLGVLVLCGVYHLCRQGGELANAVVEDTVRFAGGVSMVRSLFIRLNVILMLMAMLRFTVRTWCLRTPGSM